MNIFQKIFGKKAKPNIPPTPSRETVVQMMYDQQLDGYVQEVVRVIYSRDQSRRYVVLKDEKGFFTYQLERICFYDSVDWQYVAAHKDVLPAMWEPDCVTGKSVFGNTDDLLKEMKTEPEYQQYF